MPKNNQQNKTLEGKIKTSGRGTGYFEAADREIITISPENLNTALNGDWVKIVETGAGFGRVTEVTKRAKTNFAGKVITATDSLLTVQPDDPKFYTVINVPTPAEKIPTGHKILITMDNWTDPSQEPTGQFLSVIGPAGANETEMQAIALDRGLISIFPEAIEQEAAAIKEQAEKDLAVEATKRRDFRDITTFTIDPLTAKDFDDALSFRRLADNRFEVGVHIADVTHYVQPEIAIDLEGQKRATSVYLVDRTIPMLPEILSNDLCSLVEGRDRLAFAAVFTLNEKAEVIEEWFGKTIIKSNKRFTYEEVQTILDAKNGLFHEELAELNRLAEALDRQKIRDGALSFEEDEVVFELNPEGVPVNVFKKERLDAHKLVEDFMLLANKQVAAFVSRLVKNRDEVFVYRVHETPDQEKLADLFRFLKLFGYKMKVKGKRINAQDINNFLKEVAGTPEEDVINRMIIRSMNRALYSGKNVGHFGLAFEHYTHFTSPIRRYPDMMVHRLLEIYLSKKQPDAGLLAKYMTLCAQSSDAEKLASEAERESIKFKQAEYFSQRIGETYDGVISGITKWGVYIEEVKTGADGLARLRDMQDDYYIFDEKTFCLRGQKTKKTFRLGDKVKIKVLNADPDTRTIDFKIVVSTQ